MNYIIGTTMFLIGAAVALFSAGKPDAAWIALVALAVGWFVLGIYLLGIHHGKRTNDL